MVHVVGLDGRRMRSRTCRGTTAALRRRVMRFAAPSALSALLALVLAGSLAACFYDNTSPLSPDFGTCQTPLAPDEAAVPDDPTWYRDVQPIVITKCQGCHVDGGIGPFPMLDYADVAARSPQIYQQVDERI